MMMSSLPPRLQDRPVASSPAIVICNRSARFAISRSSDQPISYSLSNRSRTNRHDDQTINVAIDLFRSSADAAADTRASATGLATRLATQPAGDAGGVAETAVGDSAG